MNDHDILEDLQKQKQIAENIAPKFASLTADLKDVMEQSSKPEVIAAVLFKLAQEREKTNKILRRIDEKYDEIMFSLKTSQADVQQIEKSDAGVILPEQDKAIMDYITKNNSATAQDIMIALNYKGLNGACQRLNKLCKENYLTKVRSGKKVLYLLKR